MFDFFILVPLCSLAALGFAPILVFKILSHDEGTKEMIGIAQAVRESAGAYIRRQYRVSALFFAGVFILLIRRRPSPALQSGEKGAAQSQP